MATTKNRVDQDVWDKLLEAYRDDPGNHSAAARHALVQRKTARRAYELGYPDRPWGKVAIKDLIASEAELAQSRIQLEAEREDLLDDQADLEAERNREAARRAAINAKEQEIVLVGALRGTTMKALAGAVQAANGMQLAMKKIGEQLETIANGGPISHKEMMDISNMSRRYSSTLRELAAAGQMAMEMERLRVGDPTQIIGIETELDTMPLQDLVRMAGYQDKVLQRAQERGLVVLDGGLNASGGKKADGS